MRLNRDQNGFTLVELLLAMTIFTTVMVISTAGFIAMNRSFTRGTVRKQLSEAVQRTTEDITRTLRNMPQNAVAKSEERDGMNLLCLAGARYFWPTGTEATGLYRDTNGCEDQTKDRVELVDDRYRVVDLKVATVKTADTTVEDQLSGALFQVSGTFTTADTDALHDADKAKFARCKGGALSSAVRTCAVEHFSFIINARGSLE